MKNILSFIRPKGPVLKIIILLIAVFTLVKIFLMPQARSVNQLRQEFNRIQADLSVAQRVSETKLDVQQTVKNKISKFSSLENKLYKEQYFSELLQQMTDMLHKANLQVLSLNYYPQKVHRIYKEIPLEVNIKGEYNDLVQYLQQIEMLSQSVDISELQVLGDDQARGQLQIKLVILSYILR